MAMKHLKEEMHKVAENELSRANANFPLFNSPHEGYAVILEEYEEAHEALEQVKSSLDVLWERVKGIDIACFLKKKTLPMAIYEDAINAACEMVQVAAMLLKYEMSFPHIEESEGKEYE